MNMQGEQNYSDFVYALFRVVADGALPASSEGGSEALGFTDSEINQISSLTLSELRNLGKHGKHFLTKIEVDHAVLSRLLERLKQKKQEEEVQNELIKLGAPFGMMAALFGMNGHEYAEKRKGLSLTRVGRPRVPSEGEQRRLYEVYARYKHLEPQEMWLKIGNDVGVSLTTVWPLAKSWAKIGATMGRRDFSRATGASLHRICA